MATVNVTYQGHSADFVIDLDFQIGAEDLKRIAVEMIRSGGVPGLHIADLSERTFDNYVVDRFENEQRIYLRPKVPFGA